MALAEKAVQALLDADWAKNPARLERRLKLWDLRTRGIGVKAAVAIMGDGPDAPSERTLYYDWAAIREVVGAMAAANIIEVQARGVSRLEWLYSMVTATLRRDVRANTPPDIKLLREARALVETMCELQGALDRHARIEVADGTQPSPLELWESEHGTIGNGSGVGQIEAAVRGTDSGE